jgi:hypothetical protein
MKTPHPIPYQDSKRHIAKISIFEWQNSVKSQFSLNVRPITPSPDVIKRMIENMAAEMPTYRLHEVGTGFVNNEITDDDRSRIREGIHADD